jgi:hypothetical protein
MKQARTFDAKSYDLAAAFLSDEPELNTEAARANACMRHPASGRGRNRVHARDDGEDPMIRAIAELASLALFLSMLLVVGAVLQ